VARKHKHEEHVNHERWLVSFADMMTLLFALFVVLYAMGVTQLDKVKQLKESIQFAFHIDGEGKTQEPGVYDDQRGGGDTPEPAPLVTAQDGPMREFLTRQLPQEFEERTGRSLEVKLTNDELRFTMPLSALFPPGQAYPVKPEVMEWMSRVVDGSLRFSASIDLHIEAPSVLIYETESGKKVTSLDLCLQRVWTLRKAMANQPNVRGWMLDASVGEQRELSSGRASVHDWENQAIAVLAFSNKKNG
jgi:Membrane MotB of proton-channel complex MotA/MotB